MTKREIPTPEHDSKRETRVLLEDMNKSIKTVAEQHGSIVKKLEEHDKRFDRLEMAVMETSGEIKILKTDVKEVKEGQKRLEQKVDTIITDHENRLRNLEAIKS